MDGEGERNDRGGVEVVDWAEGGDQGGYGRGGRGIGHREDFKMIEADGFNWEPFRESAGTVCGSVLGNSGKQALGCADKNRLLDAVEDVDSWLKEIGGSGTGQGLGH